MFGFLLCAGSDLGASDALDSPVALYTAALA